MFRDFFLKKLFDDFFLNIRVFLRTIKILFLFVFFVTTNDKKLNVFETFSFFDENETNKNKYFRSKSFLIICLWIFFASRSIINFVNINFYKFSSLFDSMFIIFVKSFCDMSNVSLIKKNSLTNWIKFISLKR